MKSLKNKLEVLRQGADDSLNLLNPDMMDQINGGTTCDENYCKNFYSPTSGCTGTYCVKSYNSESPKPTPTPTDPPEPTSTPEPSFF